MKFKNYKFLLVGIDAILLNIAIVLALLIRFEGVVPIVYFKEVLWFAAPITFMNLAIFSIFSLYHRIWIYASINALISVFFAVSIGALLSFIFTTFIVNSPYPFSVIFISWLLNLVFIGGSRFMWRILRENIIFGKKSKIRENRVLIVGAGDAGESILREMMRSQNNYLPVGFIDDNPNKIGMFLRGIKIMGGCEDIPRIVKKHNIHEVIIAIPSVLGDKLKKIINFCQQAQVRYKTLPPLYEIFDGKASIDNIREVKEEDLLNREIINFDFDEIKPAFEGKIILVTGAGGSIGSELCRQLFKCDPKQLILLGQGENSIYHINLELCENASSCEVIPMIANIRDGERINEIMEKFRPQIVFHAAAYKHLNLMEYNPKEAYKNNVIGTKNIVEASLKFGIERFVLISTDKAVNPICVMGQTKRQAEEVVLSYKNQKTTKFMITRFGNVMNSRGSVIPLFKRQIAQKKPLTITHPEVTRFFMTIPEAVQLVIRAAIMGEGGQIFVLDMGEQKKIVDLAKDLINLSGFEFDKDIKIEYTGLKKGEKLVEELWSKEEKPFPTTNKHVLVIK